MQPAPQSLSCLPNCDFSAGHGGAAFLRCRYPSLATLDLPRNTTVVTFVFSTKGIAMELESEIYLMMVWQLAKKKKIKKKIQ